MTALLLYSCQVVLAGLLQKTEYIHSKMSGALSINYILLHNTFTMKSIWFIYIIEECESDIKPYHCIK